jgi:hypothetical protein
MEMGSRVGGFFLLGQGIFFWAGFSREFGGREMFGPQLKPGLIFCNWRHA